MQARDRLDLKVVAALAAQAHVEPAKIAVIGVGQGHHSSINHLAINPAKRRCDVNKRGKLMILRHRGDVPLRSIAKTLIHSAR